MDSGEDSIDDRENDPAMAAWWARRARLRNIADLACVSYGLRDSVHLRERIEVAIHELKDALAGRFMAVIDDQVLAFVTRHDEAAIGKLKKAVHRFESLLNDHTVLDRMPKTHAFKASLKAYREYLETIEFRRRKGSGQQRDPGHLLVRQLASRWPEIAGKQATAWPDQEGKPPSRFSLVVRGVCELLKKNGSVEIEAPSNTTIARWLSSDLPENSP